MQSRKGLCLGVLGLLLGCSTYAQSNLDIHLNKLESEISDLPLLQPRLDFSDWLKSSKSQFNLPPDTLFQWQKALAELNPEEGCEQLRYDNLKLHLKLLRTRMSLLKNLPEDANFSGRMSELPNGKQWYLHWLNSWLLLESEQSLGTQHIERLKVIANAELIKVHPKYLALSEALPETSLVRFSRFERNKIVREFRYREQKVNSNLERLFGSLQAIPSVNIQPSNLPKSFPAPGIYDNTNQTFYYHFTDQYFPLESVDWLYLHEAMPGHHLQFQVSQQQPLCPDTMFSPMPLVMAEGWAAYVETLGEQLGVFQQVSSLHYALEWRVLRALRVLIDIGIHFDGWSDEQALALWQQYLPDRMTIGRRELARIKRWPVQVITYVYGKHHIENLIQQLITKNGAEHHARIRNIVLRLSNQHPISLRTASYFLERSISK